VDEEALIYVPVNTTPSAGRFDLHQRRLTSGRSKLSSCGVGARGGAANKSLGRHGGKGMQSPVRVTFRNMDSTPTVEERIRERAEKLDQLFDRITACDVVVEAQHRHHHKGNLYHVRVDLAVPDATLVTNRAGTRNPSHEDVYVAVRDAFDAATRQLEDYVRRRRGKVKTHAPIPHGRVVEIVPAADYGVITSADGREITFYRTSVVDGDFDRLEVGDEVRFSESRGESGPVASTVHPVGKHHIAG
jgi:ribosome-associated translation inhibitor RaiA